MRRTFIFFDESPPYEFVWRARAPGTYAFFASPWFAWTGLWRIDGTNHSGDTTRVGPLHHRTARLFLFSSATGAKRRTQSSFGEPGRTTLSMAAQQRSHPRGDE